jgi:hypothetical protein
VVLFFAAPLAMALYATAVWRAHLVSTPPFVLAVAFLVGEFVPLPGGELVPLVLGVVAFAWIAVEVITLSRVSGGVARRG